MGLERFAEGTNCYLGESLKSEIEVQVPELGGTTTVVRRIPVVQEFTFVDYHAVEVEFLVDGQSIASSTFSGHLLDLEWYSVRANWARSIQPNPSVPTLSSLIALNWIPADTMRYRVTATLAMASSPNHPAQAIARVRFE